MCTKRETLNRPETTTINHYCNNILSLYRQKKNIDCWAYPTQKKISFFLNH